jgi:hypothetical protein
MERATILTINFFIGKTQKWLFGVRLAQICKMCLYETNNFFQNTSTWVPKAEVGANFESVKKMANKFFRKKFGLKRHSSIIIM